MGGNVLELDAGRSFLEEFIGSIVAQADLVNALGAKIRRMVQRFAQPSK